MKNVLINTHAIALLLLSLYLLFLFLASGHSFNFEDFVQIKLLLEILIFFIAAVALFFRKRNFLFGNTALIVLLILVQLSFIDFCIEISDIEYGDEKPIVILMLLFLLFISNLFLIYSQIKVRTSPDSRLLR
ncbi:MAG TPA: hypothetical protein VFZ33_18255 [Chitinophagaceae bacterium]